LFILILAFASFDIYIKILISFLVGKGTFFEPFVLYNTDQNVTCPLVGWWVGFGCGWAKLNVLQKRWLVCRLAALLILRRVGILFTVFLSVYVSTVGLLGLLVTVLGFAKWRIFSTNVQLKNRT
jgi:hypothetical protein